MALSTIPCTVCFSTDCDHPPACEGCMWHMAFPCLNDCICSMLVEEHGHCPICISPPGGEHARDCDDYEPKEEGNCPICKIISPPGGEHAQDCIYPMLVQENGHCPICISPPGGEHAQNCNYYEPSEE